MRTITGGLVFLALGSAVPAAAAVPVIDQDTLYVKDPASLFVVSGFGRSNWITQSLTAGVTGQLTQLDLQIWASAGDDLRVRFGKGQFTDPGFVLLWQGDIARASIPDSAAANAGVLLSIDLSGAGIGVVTGMVYSITLSSAMPPDFGNQFSWVIGERDEFGNEFYNPSYLGGAAQGSTDAGLTWTPRGVDRTFRTWVVAEVPEPATWAMMILGFGLVGSAMRSRHLASA